MSLLKKSTAGSKHTAKERLRLILIQDRASTNQDMLKTLRSKVVEAISDHLEIDESSMDIQIRRTDQSSALVANIPIKRVKRTRSGT